MTTPQPRTTAAISPTLKRIRERVAALPEAVGMSYWLPSDSDANRRAYIQGNREVIVAAARDWGLPPEMIAGIAWEEVEGAPGLVDDLAYEGRRVLPGTVHPDRTSMGPLAVQVRRAAEVLGYDPGNLTDVQRGAVVEAVRDPAQNIFIAAGYLAQMKSESPYAEVPPEDMTVEQLRDLSTRYNGGPPYWRSNDAQRYGRSFAEHLAAATAALRGE